MGNSTIPPVVTVPANRVGGMRRMSALHTQQIADTSGVSREDVVKVIEAMEYLDGDPHYGLGNPY